MADADMRVTDDEVILQLTGKIIASYVSNNEVATETLGDLIRTVHGTLMRLSSGEAGEEPQPQTLKPAIPIKKSVTPDYIVCLEDGKQLKMLKRYLRSRYNMSPEEYRAKWNLPSDYPMVAPNYAARRSAFAKEIGLGKQAAQRRGRKRKNAAF